MRLLQKKYLKSTVVKNMCLFNLYKAILGSQIKQRYYLYLRRITETDRSIYHKLTMPLFYASGTRRQEQKNIHGVRYFETY